MKNRTKIAKENEKKYFELLKAAREVVKYETEFDDELAIAIDNLGKLITTGFDDPEDFQIPKTKPKVEEPEMLTKFYNDGKPISLARHNGSETTTKHYVKTK